MLFERNVAIAEWRECRIARPPTDKEGDTPKFSFTSLDLSKNQILKMKITLSILILLVIILFFLSKNFENQYFDDVKKYLSETDFTENDLLSTSDIQHLPVPVQKYLKLTGSINKPKVKNVKIAFEGQMRFKGEDWFSFTSEQYNFFDNPARFFFMKGKVKGIPTNGYHKYSGNRACMDIRLLSLIPVVKKGDLFRVETVTLFNDMCILAPATLVNENITWREIAPNRCEATFTNKDVSIKSILYFNNEGELINFTSDDRDDTSPESPKRFSTPLKNYDTINGHYLAHYGEAIWHYPEGEFVYGKFNVVDVKYNVSD